MAILYASAISELLNSNRRESQPIRLAGHGAAIFYATEISESMKGNHRESQPIWLAELAVVLKFIVPVRCRARTERGFML